MRECASKRREVRACSLDGLASDRLFESCDETIYARADLAKYDKTAQPVVYCIRGKLG